MGRSPPPRPRSTSSRSGKWRRVTAGRRFSCATLCWSAARKHSTCSLLDVTSFRAQSQLNGIGAWSALFKVIEGLVALGEAERAAQLYPSAVDAIATGTVHPTGSEPSHREFGWGGRLQLADSGPRRKSTFRKPYVTHTTFHSVASSRRCAAGMRRCSSTAVRLATATGHARCWARRPRCIGRSACRSTWRWWRRCQRLSDGAARSHVFASRHPPRPLLRNCTVPGQFLA